MTRPVIRASDALGAALTLPPLEDRPADFLPPREPPASLLAAYRERLEADGHLDAEQVAEAVGAFASRWRHRYRTGGRVCRGCGERKPLPAFPFDPRTNDACSSRCRACESARKREARARRKATASAS